MVKKVMARIWGNWRVQWGWLLIGATILAASLLIAALLGSLIPIAVGLIISIPCLISACVDWDTPFGVFG